MPTTSWGQNRDEHRHCPAPRPPGPHKREHRRPRCVPAYARSSTHRNLPEKLSTRTTYDAAPARATSMAPDHAVPRAVELNFREPRGRRVREGGDQRDSGRRWAERAVHASGSNRTSAPEHRVGTGSACEPHTHCAAFGHCSLQRQAQYDPQLLGSPRDGPVTRPTRTLRTPRSPSSLRGARWSRAPRSG
jgi:hypothetical protein